MFGGFREISVVGVGYVVGDAMGRGWRGGWLSRVL